MKQLQSIKKSIESDHTKTIREIPLQGKSVLEVSYNKTTTFDFYHDALATNNITFETFNNHSALIFRNVVIAENGGDLVYRQESPESLESRQSGLLHSDKGSDAVGVLYFPHIKGDNGYKKRWALTGVCDRQAFEKAIVPFLSGFPDGLKLDIMRKIYQSYRLQTEFQRFLISKKVSKNLSEQYLKDPESDEFNQYLLEFANLVIKHKPEGNSSYAYAFYNTFFEKITDSDNEKLQEAHRSLITSLQPGIIYPVEYTPGTVLYYSEKNNLHMRLSRKEAVEIEEHDTTEYDDRIFRKIIYPNPDGNFDRKQYPRSGKK